ncbi:MAG TPA: hypothetical protein VEC12_02490 [Bacteroidia bacterium]|nr:hypothetical protein [Bacteroidia bacterium]
MKKSTSVKLVIVGTALSACASCKPSEQEIRDNRLHVRTDTTSRYSHGHMYGGFYRFSPYGFYSGGRYTRGGMTSNDINKGSSSYHNNTKRGGFGHKGHVVGS